MWLPWVLLAVSLVGNLVAVITLPLRGLPREPIPEVVAPICAVCRWRGTRNEPGVYGQEKRHYCEATCKWCSDMNGTAKCRAVYSPRVDTTDAEDPRWAEVEKIAREKERTT